MAVSKRTRFEVLRRDEHTCQYCGGKAPEVRLTVDHVTPVALGGSDKPDNLVAACQDCNSGKSSISPDSPLVEAVSAKAAAYALAMQDRLTKFRASLETHEDYVDEFHAAWDRWQNTATKETIPLPPDYRLSLYRWQTAGIPAAVFELAIPKAMTKRGLRGAFGEFNYMAGIVTNLASLYELDMSVTVETAVVYTSGEAEIYAGRQWAEGCQAGIRLGVFRAYNQDALARVIDAAVRDGTR